MGAAKLLLRAHIDRLRLVVAHELGFVLSALGVLLALVTFIPTVLGFLLSVIAFALGVIALTRDTRSLRQRWRDNRFFDRIAPFPAAQIPVPLAYPEADYLYFPNRGTALVSTAIDEALAAAPVPWRLTEERYRLPRELRAAAPYLVPRSGRGRIIFNGSVAGLRDDPLPQPATASGDALELRLHETTYFDFLCSNELCKYQVERPDGTRFDPIRELLVGPNGQLRTLAEGDLAEVVGISTVAITTDGIILLVQQSGRNSASEGLLAPSGSGSLEPRDLTFPEDLRACLAEGMERELREETGTTCAMSTLVTGYARWMERGGKPEFFGITRLRASESELLASKLVSQERIYTDGMVKLAVDLTGLAADLRSGVPLLDSGRIPHEVRERGSLPLLLALRAAALSPHLSDGS